MKAKPVGAFEYSRCRKVRRDKERAEACCTCRCGMAVSPHSWGRCAKCGARLAARSLARSIKDSKARLAASERRLVELRTAAR